MVKEEKIQNMAVTTINIAVNLKVLFDTAIVIGTFMSKLFD